MVSGFLRVYSKEYTGQYLDIVKNKTFLKQCLPETGNFQWITISFIECNKHN